MLNTILAIIVMSIPHVKTWMIRDLHITENQIDRELLRMRRANLQKQNEKQQQRLQKVLDQADATLQRLAAARQAEAKKAADDLDAEKKRGQEKVDRHPGEPRALATGGCPSVADASATLSVC